MTTDPFTDAWQVRYDHVAAIRDSKRNDYTGGGTGDHLANYSEAGRVLARMVGLKFSLKTDPADPFWRRAVMITRNAEKLYRTSVLVGGVTAKVAEKVGETCEDEANIALIIGADVDLEEAATRHAASDAEMRQEADNGRLFMRSDGRVERMCEHGVRHTVVVSPPHHTESVWWDHGCDGCCISWKKGSRG